MSQFFFFFFFLFSFRSLHWFGSWYGKWNHSRQQNKCLIWTECRNTSKEWPAELRSWTILVRINQWQQSISTDWSPVPSRHLCCVNSREFQSRWMGGDLHNTDIKRWCTLDRLWRQWTPKGIKITEAKKCLVVVCVCVRVCVLYFCEQFTQFHIQLEIVAVFNYGLVL